MNGATLGDRQEPLALIIVEVAHEGDGPLDMTDEPDLRLAFGAVFGVNALVTALTEIPH